MAFPAYLLLLQDNYGEKQGSNLHRTDVEQGQPKQGVKGSRALHSRTVTYLATSLANYLAFETWFRTTVKWGALWFDWTDPKDGVTKKARIVNGEYDGKPMNGTLTHWDITFQIETWVY